MSFQAQELREIPGLGGRYFASQDGRIWSLKRKAFRTTSMQRSGYLTITMRCPATKKTLTKSVHVLVAMAWIPNPQDLPQINHKDGNKTNNHVLNLEWCTPGENTRHAWRTGLVTVTERMAASAQNASACSAKARRGKPAKHASALRKLTAEQLSDARQRVLSGELQKSIAARLGVGKSTLSQALHGRTYKEV